MKKTLFMIIALLLCAVNLQAASSAGKDIYVSLETGKNKNNGSKSSPLKNLWKALEIAEVGDRIRKFDS